MRSGSNLLLVVTLSILCLGCASTWRPVPNDRIETTLTETQPDVARVQADGSVMRVRNPAVRADTLRGVVKTEREESPVSIPVASIDSLWLYRKPLRPAAGVGAAVLTMIAAAAFLWPPRIHAIH